jgi:26S proteasome regulatory subunit N10
MLSKVAKQLKKNNVAVDIVHMGEIEENREKLEAFTESINSNDNSHLVHVPAGTSPVEAIRSSPLLSMGATMGGAGSGMGGGGGGGGNLDDFAGVDPSLDPELAMAIRISTEEARAREEAKAKEAGEAGESGAGEAAGGAGAEGSGNGDGSEPSQMDMAAAADEDDPDALLQQALMLSLDASPGAGDAVAVTDVSDAYPPAPPTEAMETAATGEAGDDEDEDVRLALALSMQTSDAGGDAAASPAAETSTADSGFMDPAFIQELLSNSDADLNDPLIQAALAQLSKQDNSSEKDQEEKK